MTHFLAAVLDLEDVLRHFRITAARTAAGARNRVLMTHEIENVIAPIVRCGPDMRFFEQAITVMAGEPFVTESQKPAHGRYFILVAVLNYVNLFGVAPHPSPLSYLSAHDIEDCRIGRAALILDLSNEGPPFDYDAFHALHQQLAGLSIECRNVFFVSQNRRLREDYEVWFGTEGLRFLVLDYFPLVIVDMIAADRQHLDLNGYVPLDGTQDKLFNCLNSAPRWHRLLVFRWLQEAKFLERGLVSFHGINAENPKGNEIDLANPPPRIRTVFSELLSDLESNLPSRPIRFDEQKSYGNNLAGNILLDAYKRTNISIITESDFFQAKTVRITEKTMKALVLGHPFIVIGAANTVSLVRTLGFKTFDAIINHSYDDIEDDVDRMSRCISSIHAALLSIETDARRWRELAADDAMHNYCYARDDALAHFRTLELAPIMAVLHDTAHAAASPDA